MHAQNKQILSKLALSKNVTFRLVQRCDTCWPQVDTSTKQTGQRETSEK